MDMSKEKVAKLDNATATAEFEVGRLLWNSFRRLFQRCQLMESCENCTLIESAGFLTRTFYVKGPYWEVQTINNIIKSCLPEKE